MGQNVDTEADSTAAPLADLTGFQRDLLYVIGSTEDAEPIGRDVREELARQIDSAIQAGRFYPNVMTLEEEGLVERHEIGGGQKKVVGLTDKGRQRLQERVDWAYRMAFGEGLP